MSRPFRLSSSLLIASLVAACGSFTHAAGEPTTAAPSTRAADLIATAYRDLAAIDPARRNAARLVLLGLSRQELAALRDLVAASQPVSPAQAVALRDVVRHVYLATDTYERSATVGFLGIAFAPYPRVGAGVVDPDGPPDERGGADFRSRTPGFCAYRWLADGDVVLSLGTGDGPMGRVESVDALTAFVRATPPGTIIQMRVLRGGGVVTLRFPLDARPRALDTSTNLDAFTNDRLNRADAYWQQFFAPLVEPDHT
jgi:hypothetical protein